MDRRRFLQHSLRLGAGAAALGSSCLGGGRAAASPETSPALTPAASEPLFRISLAQWSLHRRLFGRAEPRLDPLDFARTARGLGIDAIEYVSQFYAGKATDEAYLRELAKRAEGEGVRSLLIMCDGLGALGAPDAAERAAAVARHVPWLAAAQLLGCHSIRVNADSRGTRQEQMERSAEGLRVLAAKASDHGLNVIVENHGGISCDGAWVAGVMALVDVPNCGTLPDFGNFQLDDGTWYDRYRGVREMMPWAKAVSAKSHDFDEAGNETSTDYRRMLEIVVGAGYRGFVGIEYEGRRLDEPAGILATKRLLERVRGELADP